MAAGGSDITHNQNPFVQRSNSRQNGQVSQSDPDNLGDFQHSQSVLVPESKQQEPKQTGIVTDPTENPFQQIRERSRSNERRISQLVDVELQQNASEITANVSENIIVAAKKKVKFTTNTSEEIIVSDVDDNDIQLNVSFPLLQANDNNAMDTQGGDEEDNYQVLRAALPAWRSATSHRGMEQKASMRYIHLRKELDDHHLPSWTFGMEKMPALCPATLRGY